MAKIEKLTPGQVLWSVESGRMGNTTITTKNLYSVQVVEVDLEKRRVFASWNHNPPRWRYNVSKLRVKKPVMVRGLTGRERLATRAELAAMKAKKGGE
jgi:ribosomal protein L3